MTASISPNGYNGYNGFTTTDGRVLIMTQYPERVFRNELFSWKPSEWTMSPWLTIRSSFQRKC
ncbi:phosphoribosylformylglycinamidine synthase subunit PurQ [Formosimonas limnophila]|uniref:phosphoribosylformylglycinamidine synthase subunit PurQ n=1 Tax=Formosimonas limnophila TaxID=1384487 RepID=UPI001672E762|nr:phosphoribosylformylglycinamidine synthase subunit PurQ [Formosimonas limnophila]